jgi:DNA-binding NtrC family response regulator
MSQTATVLFVGYDDLLLKLRGNTLRAAGFRVFYASCERSAVRRARRSQVDLVLLCHSLPFEDRQDIEAAVRSIHSDVPIVVLFTGLDYPDFFADLFVHAFAGTEVLLKGLTTALANSMQAVQSVGHSA